MAQDDASHVGDKPLGELADAFRPASIAKQHRERVGAEPRRNTHFARARARCGKLVTDLRVRVE